MDNIEALKSEIAQLKQENEQLKALATGAEVLSPHGINEAKLLRFRTVFESSRLGNKIIDSNLNILQVNPALVSLLGCASEKAVIGTRILDYAPVEFHKDWHVFQENLWHKSTPSFSLDTCLSKKDGTIIWVHVTSILFQDQGDTLGFTVIEDITEQHNLRLQKEEFVGIASHELKTPVTSLKAVIQLLNRVIKKEPENSTKIANLAEHAQLYTAKLIHLVDDLSDSTKIEQGQLMLNKIHFPLSNVLEECCNHIPVDGKHYITNKGDLDTEVFADQNKIEQVLINFVNNAVKYAPDAEEIIIEVENLEDKVKVTVIDQGPGIAVDSALQVFNRYYRVTKERNRRTGLGLGLYISAEIIKRHQGEIGVNTEPGKGSAFWFTLPHVTKD
ncbi:PAS domain S-box-containing protein [Pedobacter sp. CAN_A7]